MPCLSTPNYDIITLLIIVPLTMLSTHDFINVLSTQMMISCLYNTVILDMKIDTYNL